jgi:hypothetical protein
MTTLGSEDSIYDKTIERLREAGHRHDRLKFIALLAPNVIVRSPITQRIRFEGEAQTRDLFMRVFDVVSDIRVYEVVGLGTSTQVIFWRGRVGSTYLEEANLIKMNEIGQIVEMTVFMRAIPGLLELAAKLAPSLATRHSRVNALFIRVQLVLMSAIYRTAEPLVIKLARAGVAVKE